MNGYFTIVLLSFVLFFTVWGLGWFLERLSHLFLRATRNPGSRSWYMLVGPGVALHESSHALGCVFTRTEIVEFKPINVSVEGDQVILGYVKYRRPASAIKNAIINLAPVGVSLILLILFAYGATFFVPDRYGLGGAAIDLFWDLINIKANPVLLADPMYPLTQIASFVYNFLYTVGELTVLNPLFWIVAFLAMTIMFSNAPSDQDISNASAGLKFIIVFNVIWLVVAAVLPGAGWILIGLYEILAVMFTLAVAFAAVGYGFFILVVAMTKLRSPFQIIPFLGCIATALAMTLQGMGTPAFQTIVSLGVFVLITIPMLMTPRLRAEA
ncbi:MAG: hypothetical protein ACP6KW_04070 [Candidatus Thorarchaeota archaeon]